MNYITTTQLRTKSKQLLKAIGEGRSVDLVHRSKIVGVIKPKVEAQAVIFDAKKAEKLFAALKPKKLIPRNKREEVYRKNLEKKYGKGLSGR